VCSSWRRRDSTRPRQHEAIVSAQPKQRLRVAEILAIERTHPREHVAYLMDDHAVEWMPLAELDRLLSGVQIRDDDRRQAEAQAFRIERGLDLGPPGARSGDQL